MLKKIDSYRYIVPKSHKEGMRVEGMIYADYALISQIEKDLTLEQVANVAMLPGLVGRSLAMPDAHQGYGFCIGGVAAADPREGIVSAGGVGFDINCGVRLLSTELEAGQVRSRLDSLITELFRAIPCGAGRRGAALSGADLDEILAEGVMWGVRRGKWSGSDAERIEDFGRIPGADPAAVSKRARERGIGQMGTLGSGNHFLEIQRVDEIYEEQSAAAFGLRPDQIVVLLHSGSRGLGHQVCTDYIEKMQSGMKKYGITIPDRQLACVPASSPEAAEYLSAMAAAANFAFCNRQTMTEVVREVFSKVSAGADVQIVYDVCHNIAKREMHEVGGSLREVIVHRKGATRAFPAGHEALPPRFRGTGQPVLIPGSMGTCSYVLVGTERAMKETFGSCCHGAGRAKSRTQAKRETSAGELLSEMKSKGIVVRGESKAGLTEEKPDAYKDVSRVVDVVHGAGIARKVARLVPLAVMKG